MVRPIATYTLQRELLSGLWTIVGRWPDGQLVEDGEGPAEWAYDTLDEAKTFFDSLIHAASEDRGDQDSRFVDLSEVS